MSQYAFFFDQSRCYSCHACAVSCKDWNGIEEGPEKWMTVYEWEEGCFPDIRLRSLAFPCAHCDKPACKAVCPEGAIFKESEHGAVLVDSETCSGCRLCYDACPYGAPKFADSEFGLKMTKCTMCVDKLAQNELPVCVASCPLRALDFGPVKEMEEKYGSLRRLEGMPDPLTNPNFIVKPATEHIQIVPYDSERALMLMGKRQGHADVFADVSALSETPVEFLESPLLRMKHQNKEDLLRFTRNYAG